MPVVLIGYIFLIPSILGILFGVLVLVMTGQATGTTSASIKNEIRKDLKQVAIPSAIIEKVVSNATVTDADKQGLNQEQIQAVETAELTYSAVSIGAGAGTVIAGGFSVFVIIVSFCGGLLGWLLTMKRKVLQCNNCEALVNAS